MKRIAFLILLATTLSGCFKSDVEKCVDAMVAAYGPYKNEKEEQEQKAHAYLGCLKSSGGNR